ncbi:dipeptide epimerase [Desertivirga xinjiangensis]|uniref:dipeptide epimerase n=1 Tax=Desertivirga xinjiangensis TaxID=539206 RepID=UPI0021091FD3|nr:dipeptide epimerase [Pedobacter xinjiangensis]
MRISYQPYQLELKYPFRISGFSRTYTPLILLKVLHGGHIGLGEASMVPYMGENFETASQFLKQVDLSWMRPPFNYTELSIYLDGLSDGNPAIKAAIDIALHDLEGKLTGIPCFKFFGSEPDHMPVTSVTIGIDSPQIIVKKIKEAEFARVLKIKLGSDDDKMLVETIRTVSHKPLYADANQGWANKEEALDFIFWLKDKGVEILEQPMDKNNLDGNAWITERSPIPILADEAIQRLRGLDKIKGAYHGINIKLMKSAGMNEAFEMIKKAREYDMKVLIGCMSETSVATSAGIALAPLCDWADLDGPFLTNNNPFDSPAFKDGKWLLNNHPGLGIPDNNF